MACSVRSPCALISQCGAQAVIGYLSELRVNNVDINRWLPEPEHHFEG